MISNGILNRAISEAAGKAGNAARYLNGLSGVDDNGGGQANAQALSFLYPYGATLNVARPAVPVLSTGSVSFPLNRPVCAFYSHPGSGGKLAVLGSGAMFADQYIGKIKIKHVCNEIIMLILKLSNRFMRLNFKCFSRQGR